MRLTTERLILRDFVPEDWSDVLEYQANPEYLRYYAWEERRPADVQAFVAMFLAHQAEQPRTKYQFAIVLPETNRVIGNCGVRKKTADARDGDMGYELSPLYWGRGFATEAARAVAAFGFEQLGLHRLSAWCIADNAASARVLQRLGMRQEGHFRENEWFKGRYWDSLVYAILDREWEAKRRAASRA
ncbi:MAG: GNAT family protein [Anaerolineae bacterium]